MHSLQQLAATIPSGWRQTLKRFRYARLIASGRFSADEPEFEKLNEWLKEGDWAVDVGANVGSYTLRMSALVGASGRVIAFEPVPATFELLAVNVMRAPFANVTLLNAAASSSQNVVSMELPTYSGSKLENPHQARLSISGTLRVLCFSIDSLQLSKSIRLIKVDAEGHELSVLQGLSVVLGRDHPTLIVEGFDSEVEEFLGAFGYRWHVIRGSPNRVYSVASA